MNLTPIPKALEDGAEIMWAEHESVRLADLRERAASLQEVKLYFLQQREAKAPNE